MRRGVPRSSLLTYRECVTERRIGLLASSASCRNPRHARLPFQRAAAKSVPFTPCLGLSHYGATHPDKQSEPLVSLFSDSREFVAGHERQIFPARHFPQYLPTVRASFADYGLGSDGARGSDGTGCTVNPDRNRCWHACRSITERQLSYGCRVLFRPYLWTVADSAPWADETLSVGWGVPFPLHCSYLRSQTWGHRQSYS